jgi:TATA-box binding protein (TBP) (component of TFIID and TFIIIB)
MNTAYDENKITTQTIILSTNLNIDCEKLYERILIPSFDTILQPTGKKRENIKKKLLQEPSIQMGDIIFKKFKNYREGVNFKKKVESEGGSHHCKYFRNSITIITKVEDKFLNSKISNKGKVQITGCSKDVYIPQLIQIIWNLLLLHPDTFTYRETPNVFRVLVIHVMVNINFALGFQINQQQMNKTILQHTDYVSIYEKTSGYVGVNIKIHALEEKADDIPIEEYVYGLNREFISCNPIRYHEYLKTLSPKEQKKKIAKCYINTFLVFYSGKVIMPGCVSLANRVSAYNTFLNIVNTHRKEFETTYE